MRQALRTRTPQAARTDWLIWLGTRALLVATITGALPWPSYEFNDLNVYAGWVTHSLSHGQFPTDDMWQYPPLAAPVLIAGAALPQDRLGFVLVLVAFDAAVMVMVSRQARHLGPGAGRRLWALVAAIIGPLLLSRFDVVPTALAVAAVVLAARPFGSGVLSAVGAWVKVWPALALLALRRRDLPRGVLGAVTASAVIFAVMAATMRDPMSFLRGQRGRGLQLESVAAWPFVLGRALGLPIRIKYRYGAMELTGRGVPEIAQALPWLTLALLGFVVVQRLRGRLDDLPAADVALAAVLFSVATSRVFSPQYDIWLLGLAAVALCHPATRMRPTAWMLVGASVLAAIIYPFLYSQLTDGEFIGVAVQTARVALTVGATVSAGVVMLRPESAPDAQLNRPAQESSQPPRS